MSSRAPLPALRDRLRGSTGAPEQAGQVASAPTKRVIVLRPRRTRTRIHPGPRRSPRSAPAAAWYVLPLAVGCALWLWSLGRLSLEEVGDVGLLPVLPVSYWLALLSLLVGTTLALWGVELRQGLVAAHVVALVVVLYGAVAPLSPYPRGTVPWRHVGIAAHIAATGEVDPHVDAYFNWPGYFALLASYSGMAGLDDAGALMKWAPVANNLLFLVPLLIIARALTQDDRLAWSATVLFFLGNWVDQDYLAPQALGFFLYLCVLALLLTLLRTPENVPRVLLLLVPSRWRTAPRPADLAATAPPAGGHGEGAAYAVVAVVVTMAGIVAAHQLTPFALLLGVTAVAATGATSVRGLPLLAGLLTVAWLAFPAAPYMQGHLDVLIDQVGDLTGAAQGNLVERVQGSPGHLLVVRARLLFSGVLWGLGALGALQVWRKGGHQVTAAALATVPGLLFGLQSYGGEMLLRIFLFSLPFTCVLAVHVLPHASSDRARRPAGRLFLVGTLVLAPSFVLVRYGNQVIDQRSDAEVAAVRELYELSPRGSLLVAGNENTPWRGQEYADHRHKTLTALTVAGDVAVDDLPGLQQVLHDELMASQPRGLLLLTRQQRAYEDLLGRKASWTLDDLQASLRSGGAFRVLFENEDAVIMAPVPGPRR